MRRYFFFLIFHIKPSESQGSYKFETVSMVHYVFVLAFFCVLAFNCGLCVCRVLCMCGRPVKCMVQRFSTEHDWHGGSENGPPQPEKPQERGRIEDRDKYVWFGNMGRWIGETREKSAVLCRDHWNGQKRTCTSQLATTTISHNITQNHHLKSFKCCYKLYANEAMQWHRAYEQQHVVTIVAIVTNSTVKKFHPWPFLPPLSMVMVMVCVSVCEPHSDTASFSCMVY